MSADLIYLFSRVPLITTLPLCEAQPSAMCTCGGLLDYQAGAWFHVQACIQCWPVIDQPCPDRSRHAACVDPEPVGCAHDTCRDSAMIESVCANGGRPRSCCGCCWELADIREGKSLWPTTT